jgi:hypothetical protein
VPAIWLWWTVVMFTLVFRMMMTVFFLFALQAVFPSTRPLLAMLRLDALPIRAGVRIVIHLTVFWFVFV